MTLRTALVIDGDARGAAAAAAQASAGLKQLDAATNAATAATRVNTAAQQANNAMTRQAVAQRTNLIFQLNDIFVSLASGQNPAMVAIQQGSQISTIYGPGGLGKALTETGKLAVSAATKFAPLLIATSLVAAGIAGLTHEINSTRKGIDVSFGDTALAILQTFGDYIWEAIGPAVSAISGWFAKAWNASWPTIKTFGNMLVGTFAGAFDAMKAVWSTLPDVMGDVVFEIHPSDKRVSLWSAMPITGANGKKTYVVCEYKKYNYLQSETSLSTGKSICYQSVPFVVDQKSRPGYFGRRLRRKRADIYNYNSTNGCSQQLHRPIINHSELSEKSACQSRQPRDAFNKKLSRVELNRILLIGF